MTIDSHELIQPGIFKLDKSEKKLSQETRISIRLTETLGDAISDIQEKTSARNPSDVIREAISVYHTLVRQKVAGNEPSIVVSENGKLKEIIPLFS